MSLRDAYLITCEHGGNRIPAAYRTLFLGHESLLQTHRGYDAGALLMARELAVSLGAPLIYSTYSRLLIDLNRSRGHPRLYSEATRATPPQVRQAIFAQYYAPYREQAEQQIAAQIAQGRRVIHLSSHSFTPILDGEERNTDIGLLYDPARSGEKSLCTYWAAAFKAVAPQLKVRRNYPYTGTSDGFTAYLRRQFSADAYLGIELEINQQQVFKGGRHWQAMRQVVMASLQQALREFAA